MEWHVERLKHSDYGVRVAWLDHHLDPYCCFEVPEDSIEAYRAAWRLADRHPGCRLAAEADRYREAAAQALEDSAAYRHERVYITALRVLWGLADYWHEAAGVPAAAGADSALPLRAALHGSFAFSPGSRIRVRAYRPQRIDGLTPDVPPTAASLDTLEMPFLGKYLTALDALDDPDDRTEIQLWRQVAVWKEFLSPVQADHAAATDDGNARLRNLARYYEFLYETVLAQPPAELDNALVSFVSFSLALLSVLQQRQAGLDVYLARPSLIYEVVARHAPDMGTAHRALLQFLDTEPDPVVRARLGQRLLLSLRENPSCRRPLLTRLRKQPRSQAR